MIRVGIFILLTADIETTYANCSVRVFFILLTENIETTYAYRYPSECLIFFRMLTTTDIEATYAYSYQPASINVPWRWYYFTCRRHWRCICVHVLLCVFLIFRATNIGYFSPFRFRIGANSGTLAMALKLPWFCRSAIFADSQAMAGEYSFMRVSNLCWG
jgi:hypothetical protein